MINLEQIPQLLPEKEQYCIPGLNEVRCVTDNQTMSLSLGSCISTVFIGRSDRYYLAANHIVIAKPQRGSILATKSALEQINEIDTLFRNDLHIDKNSIICLYLIGAGSRNEKKEFTVPIHNIIESMKILNDLNYPLLFHDTGSYFFATFSLKDRLLSIFIENKFRKTHISFMLDLDKFFPVIERGMYIQSISALEPRNEGFEHLVREEAIVCITGDKRRKYG